MFICNKKNIRASKEEFGELESCIVVCSKKRLIRITVCLIRKISFE